MAAEIGPGTLLICVDARLPPNRVVNILTHGALYRIYDIVTKRDGRIRYELVDKYHPSGGHWRFPPNRFKPLIDGDGVIIEEEIKEPEHATT